MVGRKDGEVVALLRLLVVNSRYFISSVRALMAAVGFEIMNF